MSFRYNFVKTSTLKVLYWKKTISILNSFIANDKTWNYGFKIPNNMNWYKKEKSFKSYLFFLTFCFKKSFTGCSTKFISCVIFKTWNAGKVIYISTLDFINDNIFHWHVLLTLWERHYDICKFEGNLKTVIPCLLWICVWVGLMHLRFTIFLKHFVGK